MVKKQEKKKLKMDCTVAKKIQTAISLYENKKLGVSKFQLCAKVEPNILV